MIKIKYEYKGRTKEIYTKLEYYNFSGSIKDRVIYNNLEKAIKENKLKKGMTLVEATSGNTGVSLSAIGAKMGYKVKIFMPNWVSEERLKIMKLYGADVTLVSKDEGGFRKCIELAKKIENENNGFCTNQFSNKDNIEAHYNTTGKEICEKINVDAFVSGIGTGGTLMGVGKRIKEENSKAKIYALEPETMSLIKCKNIGNHKIEGIGDDFIPDIVNTQEIEDIFLIKDEDAINMSKKISRELGIGVGISSGANFLAAIQCAEIEKGNIVTVFPDDLKKYLSTDFSKEKNENNKELISDQIKLIDFVTI